MPPSLDLHNGWSHLNDVVVQLNASNVDSTKVLPPSDPNHPCCDASWALGIGNVPAGGATVNFYVTSTPPSGFYLMQTNEITGDAVYLSAEMRANTPVPPTVPEPSTLTLLGTGIAGFFGVYRFRKSRCSWHFVLRNTYESGKLLAIQFWV